MSLLKTHVKLLPLVLTGAYLANRYGVHDAFADFYNKDVWLWNPITNTKAMIEFANYGKYGDSGFNPALYTFFGGFIPYVIGMGIWHSIFRKSNSNVHGSAKWATLKELKRKFNVIAPLNVRGSDGRPGIIIGATEHPDGELFSRPDPEDNTKKINIQLKPLLYTGSSHICLLAPTGGGKGVGIIVPNLLNYPDSIVVNDMKGTEFKRTAGWRAEHLNNLVLKFEPASQDDDSSSVKFNPLDFIQVGTEAEYLQAQKISLQLIDIEGKGINGDHFKSNGADLLAAIILHVLYTRKNNSPADVLAFLSGVDPDTDKPYEGVKQFLAEMCGAQFKAKPKKGGTSTSTQVDEANTTPPKSHLQAYAEVRGLTIEQAKLQLGNLVDSFGYVRTVKKVALALFNNDGEKEVAGIISSAKTALGLFNSPVIAANTKTSTINLRDLQNGERPTSLYIVVKKEYQALLNPLIRVLLSQIFEEVHRNDIKNIKRELTFFLDEFPQLGQIDDVATTMATIREFKARFLLVTQNLDFFEKYYGKEGAQVILGNCDIKICYPNGSKPTNDLIAEWVGYTTITEKNVSKSVQRQGMFQGSSVTTQISQTNTKRHLIMPDEIATMGDMTIIYMVGKGPIKGTAYRYYEDKPILARIDKPIPIQKYIPSVVAKNVVQNKKTDEDMKPSTETDFAIANKKALISDNFKHIEEIINARKHNSFSSFMQDKITKNGE
jgi:type IV secretion system protein VirD4